MTILKFSTTLFGSAPTEGLAANPLHGRALAEMLRIEFEILNYRTDALISEQDWGWCFNMQYYRKKYLIGTLAYSDSDLVETKASKPVQYLVQFDKIRTLKEKILRQNKFAPDEPIIDLTTAILKFKILDMTDFSKVS